MELIIDNGKCDMIDSLRQDAEEVILNAFRNEDNSGQEKNISAEIRKQFDERHYPQWHCIVGKKFGSSVTHEKGTLMYGSIGDYGVMLWKAGQ